jgi:squalene-hopene/tetraprenyl-beta-curcumene cyclase
MTLTSATSQIDQLNAGAALERAVAHLQSRQHADGWWKGALDTNVTMDAEDLLLRQFLGIRGERETRMAANWIRSQQQEDGSWGQFFGADGDLSTTIEAYAALRLAGDPPDAEHMRRACACVLEAGGIEGARTFTHIWLALFGLWRWDDLPALPPELMLLPARAPLSIYQFGCWARQTVAALTVVMDAKPVRPLPFGLDELRHGSERPSRTNPVHTSWTFASRAGVIFALDRAARAYSRRPLRALREHALQRAEAWIVARQEADGSWGGIQPPWVYSLIALQLRGYAIDHPVMRAGLEGLDRFLIEDGEMRRLEACQSPVWDTALAVIALSDGGVPADDPGLVRAGEWLLNEEVRVRGDWAIQRPDLEPGGWAFEFFNDTYPDIDDTAEVALALRRVAHPEPERVEAAVARGVRWTLGMQSSDGGWAAFDADNTSTLISDIPFCDFGEVTDPPSADVTAHAVEMLAREGRVGDEAFARGLRWLRDAQEADGSWFGRWGVNHVYGTSAALLALEAAGAGADDAQVRRAVRWLKERQNADGGWGEDPRSYVDPAWIGRGPSTASQTAWALLALHAAGERSEAMTRGVGWLVEQQQADGGWDEPQYTGTGFPGDFYINYELYRLVFPVMALGRCVRSAS